MHKQGTPQNMQINPQYLDVVAEVYQYFAEKLGDLSVSGQEQIILDPGFGFGKTIDHNYQLLNQLHKFSNFNKPILVGLSRKSMIYKLLQISPNESLPATTALNMVAALNGASILRVHDVKEAVQAIKLATALQAGKE
jgi:dihydropteroate synthase